MPCLEEGGEKQLEKCATAACQFEFSSSVLWHCLSSLIPMSCFCITIQITVIIISIVYLFAGAPGFLLSLGQKQKLFSY